MKKEHIALIIILIVAASFRLYNLRHPYFIGNDAFLHASVIRQALNNGNLATYELSFYRPQILEPLGFYYVTLIPATIIGLDIAFLLMPLISGLLCVLLLYLLMKDLFNTRVGLIAALILALSLGHMYRTSPNSYRGDGFFLTIFLAILYYFNKTIKGTTKDAVITGVLMALSATLWGGYPIGVLVIISGLIINATLKFFKGKFEKKELTKTFAVLASYYFLELMLMLLGVVKQSFFTRNTGFHALITFSPLIIGLIYYFTRKVKKSNVMIIMFVAGLIILGLNASTISSMVNEGLFENSLFYEIGVSELLPPKLGLLYTMLSWTLYLMWPGLIILSLVIFKKQKPEYLTYLVWIAVSIYLLLSYSRYTFIASVTTASLTALLLNYFFNRKKTTMYYSMIFLTIVVISSFILFMSDEFVKKEIDLIPALELFSKNASTLFNSVLLSIFISGVLVFILNYLDRKLLSLSKKLSKRAGRLLLNIFAITLFIVFFASYTVESITNVERIGPRMSAVWEDALNWMSDNLEPGVALSWWDHGSWIQYYTGFQTVTDSVTGQDQHRIQRTAQFLTTNNSDRFSDWSVKYLVLGGDVILYSGAVLGIAGTEGFTMSMVGVGVETQGITVYPIVDGQFQAHPQGTIFTNEQGSFVLTKTFYANSTGAMVSYSDYNTTQGCLVVNPYTNFYFNEQACDSNYVKLMYGEDLDGFKELYRNDFVVVYELI